MGTHDGHRERIKESFLKQNEDALNDLNILEMLLFYSIPRRDTNELAHRLIDSFGSLRAVLDAPESDICAVEGIGQNTAVFMKLVRTAAKRYAEPVNEHPRCITGTEDAAKYLMPYLRFERQEKAMILCLDTRNAVLACRELNKGTVNRVNISVRQIVEIAVRCGASSVIMAHNHPDGYALPSREDKAITAEVFRALEIVQIPLVDHIIISGNDYVSFADSGMLGR